MKAWLPLSGGCRKPNESICREEKRRRRTVIYTDENFLPPYNLPECQRAPGSLPNATLLECCEGEALRPRRVGKCKISLTPCRSSLPLDLYVVAFPNVSSENCNQQIHFSGCLHTFQHPTLTLRNIFP